ncbi:hypothetical protein H0H92_005170 [Tricholoma furcatifolium]|nr:hypothetical protein H0H92_005170 [Tricholoma furcatifolium]
MTRRGGQNKKIPKPFNKFRGSLQHWGWKRNEAFPENPEDVASSSSDPLPPPISGTSQPGIQFQFIDYQHPVSAGGSSAGSASPGVSQAGNSSTSSQRPSRTSSPRGSPRPNSRNASRSSQSSGSRRRSLGQTDRNNTEILRLSNGQSSSRASSHQDGLEAGNISPSSSSSSRDSYTHLSSSQATVSSLNQQPSLNQNQRFMSLSPSTSPHVHSTSTNPAQFPPAQAMQHLSTENYSLPHASMDFPPARQQFLNSYPMMGSNEMADDRHVHSRNRNNHAMGVGSIQASTDRYFNSSFSDEYHTTHAQMRPPAASYGPMSDSSSMPPMNPEASSGYNAAPFYRQSMDQYFYTSSSSNHYFSPGENHSGASQSTAPSSFPAPLFDSMMVPEVSSHHPASRRRPTDLGPVPGSYAMEFGAGYSSGMGMTNALGTATPEMNYTNASQSYMYQGNSGFSGENPSQGGPHPHSTSRGRGY